MENVKIVFTEPWKAEVRHEPFQVHTLQANQVVVKKLYSLISPGTELACLSGTESWFRMPAVPGYASVSEIVDKGTGVTEFEAGDRVFHYGNHAKFQVVSTDELMLKVPETLDLKMVPFTRMATVAMTSIRASQIELGDYVAVTGLGLVGNMASQLARLQGATVLGVDLSENRLQMASSCGLDYAIHPGSTDPKRRISEITGGHGVSTLIEATGVPKVAVEALPWIGRLGEIILLGSPRGEYQTDVTDVLNYCHLYNLGCITFKGAHEWRYPVKPAEFVKHSLARNSQIVFELMVSGKLSVKPLLSHVLKPDEAPSAYEGLKSRKDEFQGVLFDWM
jgi:2-desacetyl-2-hydroxyethyl bacteriochlorophyllide A dehydrogenase